MSATTTTVIQNRARQGDYLTTKLEDDHKHDEPTASSAEDTIIRSTFDEEPARQFRYRNVVFTVNNWDEDTYQYIWSCDVASYLVMGREIAPSGTPHLQGYAEFKGKQLSWAQVQKHLGGHAWFQARKGTPEQAANYCKEDGKFEERGRISKPGAASVIEDAVAQLVDGVTLDEMVMTQPLVHHMYGRTLTRAEVIVQRDKIRGWFTRGIWYWGPTGTGKSHRALEGYSRATHYIAPGDGGWFDGYAGQETFVINEYRGSGINEPDFTELLKMCSWEPHWLRRRGVEPVPFMAKTVIITSPFSPNEMFQSRIGSADSIDQLLRRFTVLNLTQVYGENISESSGVIVRPRADIVEEKVRYEPGIERPNMSMANFTEWQRQQDAHIARLPKLRPLPPMPLDITENQIREGNLLRGWGNLVTFQKANKMCTISWEDYKTERAKGQHPN